MGKASIIVAGDEILLRKFLRMVIQTEPEYVISEADDCLDLQRQLGVTTPDVAILDIAAPSLSGLEVVEMIKKNYPEVKIVILTKLPDQDHFRQAIRMGVEGYVLKRDIGKIDYIINNVLQGGTYISSHISN